MAIYDILESKLGNRDKDEFTCAVYLDLSKAFDTVDSNLYQKNSNITGFVESHYNYSKVIWKIDSNAQILGGSYPH